MNSLLHEKAEFTPLLMRLAEYGIDLDPFLRGAHRLDKATLRRRLKANVLRIPNAEALLGVLGSNAIQEHKEPDFGQFEAALASVKKLVETAPLKVRKIYHKTDENGKFYTEIVEERLPEAQGEPCKVGQNPGRDDCIPADKEPAKKPKLSKEERAAQSEEKFRQLMATKSPEDRQAFEQARADGIAIPPAWTEVTYHGADKDIRAEGRDEKGRKQRAENPAYRQRISDENNARIAKELTPRIDTIREALRKDAESGDEEAKVLYLISLTGFRIGGSGDNKAKVKAYGASTLQGEHVKVDGDTVHFDFLGKKGVRQQHAITDPVIADMMKNAEPGKPIFNTRDTKVREAWQNKYGGTKVHDIRHVVATELALEELQKRIPPPPKSEKEKIKLKKEIATVSGAKLGNNPSQALGTYIDPGIWDQVQVAA